MTATSLIFRFESDFADSLRCIPMAVRMKLDVSGIKLKLSEWSKLGKKERETLAIAPCQSMDEVEIYRQLLSALVVEACGTPPALLPLSDESFPWESPEMPAQVLEKAASQGIPLRADGWNTLTPLQRFALIKLSRPSHEGKNFGPALEEFGLISA